MDLFSPDCGYLQLNSFGVHRELAYFLLGSNVGDRIKNLEYAVEAMAGEIGELVRSSKFYETAPWGELQQQPFINQAIVMGTTLSPHTVLRKALAIQYKAQVKPKKSKYGPRVLDIDLLIQGEAVIRSADLTLPHPRMHKRNFVLIPLAEIAGQVIHPVFGRSINDLLDACQDTGAVSEYAPHDD